jgi:phenylacetate-coenzyme A ligase PaaK-like adenylate-forming protein
MTGPAAHPWTLMRQRLPVLDVDLDEWTRRMMRWHFSPETGSAFWLNRRAGLGFDPLADVTCFADLRLFGPFDKEELRRCRVNDLIPRGFAGRPVRVVETGGTTGAPCRVVDITRAIQDVAMYRVILEIRGLGGGNVLAMTPSGPHAYGHFVTRLAQSWGGAALAIDFDPRWVKQELRTNGTASAYVAHLVAQTELLLAAERPELLFTTSKLLATLAVELGAPLAEYGVRAVCTGGTSCTPEEVRFLRENHLRDVQWIDTYGNTLVGHALQADPQSPDQAHAYYLPPPLAVLRVVDPADTDREVPVGYRGRVLATTLLEDLFLPNLLERDSAVRTGPHPWFPWDGVQAVMPYLVDHADAVEGIY